MYILISGFMDPYGVGTLGIYFMLACLILWFKESVLKKHNHNALTIYRFITVRNGFSAKLFPFVAKQIVGVLLINFLNTSSVSAILFKGIYQIIV